MSYKKEIVSVSWLHSSLLWLGISNFLNIDFFICYIFYYYYFFSYDNFRNIAQTLSMEEEKQVKLVNLKILKRTERQGSPFGIGRSRLLKSDT